MEEESVEILIETGVEAYEDNFKFVSKGNVIVF